MPNLYPEAPQTQTAEQRLGIEKSKLELTEYLLAEDPLPMVIRAHLDVTPVCHPAITRVLG
jgi:hypothetical protein